MTQSKELKQVRDALQNLMTHSNPRLEQKYADAIKVGVEALSTLDRIIASPTPERTEIDLDVDTNPEKV